tara:strand:- start:723 stop:1673 length:951 start_codon:yes stop_codon:yes gene_type:complete
MNSIIKKFSSSILCIFCIFSISNSWSLESYVGELFKTDRPITLYTATQAKQEEINSIFWQVTDLEGKEHYLFGTIHSDDNRISNFNPIVLDKLKEIDVFVMETDEIIDRSILRVDPKVYKSFLSKEELEKVNLLADFHTMPREHILSMKPWILAVIFDSPRPITPFNQDNLLKAKAEDFSKITQGLESPREHFKALDNFTIEEQMSLLKAVLQKDLEQKEVNYELLISAYLTFDIEKILNTDILITKSLVSESIWEKMELNFLTKRNKLFGERIKELIKGNRIFIAVGASHLGGETGLLNQFKEAGFKLKPIYALD